MARILICHVPKDGGIAREIGAALMGRDHFISFDGEPDTIRPDRVTRLRQFDAVMVLWTEQSLNSAGLEEIAREALPANLLVPVRSEKVATGSLPLAFRKLNMYALRDLDAINRTVIRLGAAAAQLKDMAARTAEMKREPPARPPALPPFVKKAPSPPAPPAAAPVAESAKAAPAPEPSPRVTAPPAAQSSEPAADVPRSAAPIAVRRLELPEVTPSAEDQGASPEPRAPHAPAPPAAPAVPNSTPVPVATAIDLAKLVEAGLIQLHMPPQMWLAEPVVVEVRLSKTVLEDLARNARHPRAEHGPLETLSVSLYSHGDAFAIERQSERTQFVSPRASASRAPVNSGRWMWLVTPNARGEQALVLRVSALLRDRHGVPGPVALPDRRLAVMVDAPEGSAAMNQLMSRARR